MAERHAARAFDGLSLEADSWISKPMGRSNARWMLGRFMGTACTDYPSVSDRSATAALHQGLQVTLVVPVAVPGRRAVDDHRMVQQRTSGRLLDYRA